MKYNPESIEPIPIKELGNEIVFVDGHTRAFAAFLHDLSGVPVYWEDEELDWDACEICVRWCKKNGIHTIADLRKELCLKRIMRYYGTSAAKKCNRTWQKENRTRAQTLKTGILME